MIDCRCLRILMLMLPIGFGLVQPQAHGAAVDGGHSGLWHDPTLDGQGWFIEVTGPDTALLYWFTYDESGAQRWLTAYGAIDQSGINFPELLEFSGGQFGPGHDPAQLEFQVVGQATMSFSDCLNGSFSYQAYGQQQTLAVTRLTRVMGRSCRPLHAMPAREYAGQSGHWFDPDRSGEGFMMHWHSPDLAVFLWFGFGPDGEQMWLIGTGRYEAGQIRFSDVLVTRGPRFGLVYDPADLVRTGWGDVSMTLECLDGEATYQSVLDGFGTGAWNLARLTLLEGLSCPPAQVDFLELFDLQLTEVPLTHDGQPVNARPSKIASDGTVAAISPGEAMWRWRPGSETLEFLSDAQDFLVELNRTPIMASDGSYMLNSRLLPNDSNAEIVIWREATGHTVLPGVMMRSAVPQGISRNGFHIVGRGRTEFDFAPDVPFIWNEADGLQLLELESEFDAGVAEGVSDDGRIAVGQQIGPPIPGEWPITWRRDHATRWVDGVPEQLTDYNGVLLGRPLSCNADCSMIVGSGQGANADPTADNFGTSWFWTEHAGVTYLQGPDGQAPLTQNYVVEVSADGAILVGIYYRIVDDTAIAYSPMLYAHLTGMVDVFDLLQRAGLGDNDWFDVMVSSITPAGDRLLLSGQRGTSGNYQARGQVLRLIPRFPD